MVDPRAMQRQLEEQRRKVDVDSYTITVRELLSMAENEELHRAPEYQRKFRWNEEAESRLIESLLLGLPVPSVFFATNLDGSWEVVDGLQRISTLIHFASESANQMSEIEKDAPLRLKGLKKLSEFDGLTFSDLPPPVRMAFLKRGLGVTALSDKSDPGTRFDTFERLNRGAVELSPQEVRACIFEGTFNFLLRTLAGDSEFKSIVKLQRKNEHNATREELVLKFFAYRHGRNDFGGAVHAFLNSFMERNRNPDKPRLAELELEFRQMVTALRGILNGHPLLRVGVHVTPQNELEAVMVATAEVLEEYGEIRTPRRGWLEDSVLVEASTGATNTATKLRARIARAKELLTPTS